MIIFDLRCRAAGHVFEAWFGSSADYEDQQGRGLVACPICGAGEVEKAPMAPAVPRKGDAERAAPALFSAKPEEVKAMLGAIAAMQRELIKSSDWVGDGFAAEARAIHLGEAEARQIHGRASREDAESLLEDGIPVAPLLCSAVPSGQEN